MNKDLEDLIRAKIEVLTEFKETFTDIKDNLTFGNALCYYIESPDGVLYPAIDFTRHMPNTIRRYQQEIMDSVQDFIEYDNIIDGGYYLN